MKFIVEIKEKYKNGPIQFKASLWFLVCSFVQKVISVITTPIFTRLMTTDEYGSFNVFWSWMNVIMVVISLNLFYEVFEQGLVKFSNKRSVFAASMQGLELTIISIWGIIYALFYKQWNKLFSLSTVQMVLMLWIIWTTACFNFWAAEQRVIYQYKKLVILTIATSVLSPLVSVVLVSVAADKVTARILGIASVQAILYTGLFISQIKRGKRFFEKKYWKYALKLNIPLVPHYLSQTVLNSADRIMIGKMVGEASAGIYSLAYSISLVMMVFNYALNQTIGPWYFQKIKENKIQDISKIGYLLFEIIAMVNLILIAFAPEAVRIFAPKSYYSAIWIIPPIAMSVYFTFAYDMFCKFEFYYEKSKLIAGITIIGAIVNVGLNYWLIPIFGYQAAAYTTLLCYCIYAVFHYCGMKLICKKELNSEPPFRIGCLLKITSVFMILGFAFQASYYLIYIRYIMIVTMFGILVVFRRKILKYIKSIALIKKE